MSGNWRQWLKPAALLATAAIFLRAERQLSQADRRQADRTTMSEAIDDRTEREAEEQLSEPTLWPVILAVGVFFGLWGIILHNFFFVMGLLIVIIALAGWMNLVARGKAPYIHTTPHEAPWSK